MTLQQFIDDNRGALDAKIRDTLADPNFNLDDSERELWIANDEGLYQWAAAEGVDPDEDDDEEEEASE